MTMIMTGVAKTGGNIASLNRFARCSGCTRRLKEPFAPTGMDFIAKLSRSLAELQPPQLVGYSASGNASGLFQPTVGILHVVGGIDEKASICCGCSGHH